jgi:hypothetical protein
VVLETLEKELELSSASSPAFFLKGDVSTLSLLISKRHVLR